MQPLLLIIGLPVAAWIVWVGARYASRTIRIRMAARGKPTVRLRLTRDSVGMADDVDAPHERTVEVPAFADPAALATSLLRYVPHFPTGWAPGHWWTCEVNEQPVATVGGDGPRVRALVPEVIYGESNHVHFSYLVAQETVRLRLTRDSVGMADDVDFPHEQEAVVPRVSYPAQLVTFLLWYLPSVGGSGHSWACAFNGQTIATVEGNGRRVRAEAPVVYGESNHVHFSYTTARENGNTRSDRSSE